MDKVTYKSFVEYALSVLPEDASNDMVEVGKKLLAKLEKQNTANRKPTKTDTENDAYIDEIVATFRDTGEFTAKEVREQVDSMSALMPQRISGILQRGYKAGRLIARKDEQKHTWYVVAEEEE